MFISEIVFAPGEDADLGRYPFTLPAVAKLGTLVVDRPVTFLTGEYGIGKSTLLSAIAIAAGLDGVPATTDLWRHLRLTREEPRPYSGGLLGAHEMLDPSTTGRDGLYMLDEPEVGLTVGDQVALVRRMHVLAQQRSQFLLVTNSPIILAMPDARIYSLGDAGVTALEFADTAQYAMARGFMADPSRLVEHVIAPDPRL